MKLAFVDDHHNASKEWEGRDQLDWLTDVFEARSIVLEPGCTNAVRRHVSREFEAEGWARDVKIDEELNLTVFALKDDLAFQLQTGNMSRAPYDLLKFEYLYKSDRIRAAALALPTKEAAKKIGSNIANAQRVIRELDVFRHVINVPIYVVAFD